MELAPLAGFLASCSDVAPIGLTRDLHAVWRTRCRNIQALRLRGVHTAAHPDARKRRKFPSQDWALLHSFTDFTRHRETTPRCRPFHAPSEVPSPSAFCQSRGATLLRRDPSPPVTLRPQGFAPSRRFAPPTTCRACFIPVPLLGFPFEACSPHGAVRSLERRTPQVFDDVLADAASPSGIEHTVQILPAGLGFSQVTTALPPWVWPSRGVLPGPVVSRVTSPPPLSRFSEQAAC